MENCHSMYDDVILFDISLKEMRQKKHNLAKQINRINLNENENINILIRPLVL